jgi:hypothetical protein
MANLIGVVGSSGDGKSTSIFPNADIGIIGLNPAETLYINVSAKPIPARGANKMYPKDKKISEGGNYYQGDNMDEILKLIDYCSANRKDIVNYVIDDGNYLMAFDMMAKAKDKGYEKFTEVAQKMWKIVDKLRKLPENVDVFCLFHQEKGEDGKLKIKTSGKLIDNSIYLDGLFTTILYARPILEDFKTGKMKYQFMTQTDGESTCKSPVGMFADKYIPNDLGYVKETIYKYYNE